MSRRQTMDLKEERLPTLNSQTDWAPTSNSPSRLTHCLLPPGPLVHCPSPSTPARGDPFLLTSCTSRHTHTHGPLTHDQPSKYTIIEDLKTPLCRQRNPPPCIQHVFSLDFYCVHPSAGEQYLVLCVFVLCKVELLGLAAAVPGDAGETDPGSPCCSRQYVFTAV